jgi:hypothetical protein
VRGFFPLDQQLELWDGHWSEQIAKQAVRLSGEVDFAEAAQILRDVGQVEISTTSVWRRAEKWGQRLKDAECQEQERAYGPAAQSEQFLRESHSQGRKGVSMDGTMIYIRGEEWKELKVGCFFDVVVLPTVDPQTKDRLDLGHALHNSYVSHLGGPEEFGRALWTEAQRRQWDRAVDTEVVADGATWIWNLVADMFYDSHEVVDWFHGKEHLARAAHLRFGEGSPEAKRWVKEQETTLFQGQVEQIIQAIGALGGQKPDLQGELQSEAGYFEKHKRRMNYLEMRTEGWVIGSGMVESGGKQFKHRFAGAGMRWSRVGAERLLPVRTAIMSNRFDQRWKAAYNSPLN